jgi:hypothetical protein
MSNPTRKPRGITIERALPSAPVHIPDGSGTSVQAPKQMSSMTSEGRLAPGAQPAPVATLRELARPFAIEALAVLRDIMLDRANKPADRTAAATELLNRGFGKEEKSAGLAPVTAISLHLDALKVTNAQAQHAKVIEGRMSAVRDALRGTSGGTDAEKA